VAMVYGGFYDGLVWSLNLVFPSENTYRGTKVSVPFRIGFFGANLEGFFDQKAVVSLILI